MILIIEIFYENWHKHFCKDIISVIPSEDLGNASSQALKRNMSKWLSDQVITDWIGSTSSKTTLTRN